MAKPTRTPTTGRDERNLLEFPIGVSGKMQPLDDNGEFAKEITRCVEVYDENLNQIVPKQLVIRTSSKHGFITGYDIEVLMGLFALHFQTDGFESAKMAFSNRDLYDLMRWPQGSGANNERLQTALDRFAGVQLTFENSWSTDGGKTKHKTYSTGVLDSYHFTKTSDVRDEGESWIRWSGELFVGFQQGNIKPLDTDSFFSLKRPISQQAYRLLDDAFMASPEFEMNLQEFATRVGISNPKTGVIKQRLEPVIEELLNLPGFIASDEKEPRYTKKGAGKWSIHFTVGTRVPSKPNTQQHSSKDAKSASTDHDPAAQFVRNFYLQWRGEKIHAVKPKERALAEHLLSSYEQLHLEAALPEVVKELKLWKAAKTFGASASYWHNQVERVRRKAAKKVAIAALEPEQEHRQQRFDRKAWRALSLEEKLPIIERVKSSTKVTFVKTQIEKKKYDDPLLEGECIALWQRTRFAS